MKLLPPAYADPSVGHAEKSSTSWEDRQGALKLLSQFTFSAAGKKSIPVCAKCDPGNVDGKPGPKTTAAVKAFQELAMLAADGLWDSEEDAAMFRIFEALKKGAPLECDPLHKYDGPLGCFLHGKRYILAPTLANGKTTPKLPPAPQLSDDVAELAVVADPGCNHIISSSPKWYNELKKRTIGYALDGATGHEAAQEIVEGMLADHLPLCLTLGQNGVGDGVSDFWTMNLTNTKNLLQAYEYLPLTLEEDAEAFGLL